MEPEEFVIWLKGFAESANAYNITPKQWEIVKEQLDNIIMEAEILEEDENEEETNLGFNNWYLSGTFPASVTNVRVEYVEGY